MASDRAAGPAERSRRPNYQRDTQLVHHPLSIRHRMCDCRTRNLEPNFEHRVLEQLAVLSLLDRFELCADQLALESIEYTRFGQLDRQVERSLSANRRQQRVGTFALDN